MVESCAGVPLLSPCEIRDLPSETQMAAVATIALRPSIRNVASPEMLHQVLFSLLLGYTEDQASPFSGRHVYRSAESIPCSAGSCASVPVPEISHTGLAAFEEHWSRALVAFSSRLSLENAS